VRKALDASYQGAQTALAALLAHPFGEQLARALRLQLDAALIHLLDYNRYLATVAPEWYWRDYRLRHSRGHNPAWDERLKRATLLWAIYRNFTPSLWRFEHKRHYRHPGQSPPTAAGAPPRQLSYLDALCV
jgi:hypothetical protein